VSSIEGEAIKIGVSAWVAAIELRLDSQQSFYHSALAHVGAPTVVGNCAKAVRPPYNKRKNNRSR